MSALDRGATYTYAVARPFDAARIAGLHGVDGAPVRLIGYRNVVAVVSAASRGNSTRPRCVLDSSDSTNSS